MAYRIQISKRFEVNTRKVYEYIAEEFGIAVANEFTERLYSRIYSLLITPFSGIVCDAEKGTRKIVISKHNKVYYRISGDTVFVLTLFSSKLNPSKNRYE
jgi:plasmid stabilization system protein ParE